MRTYDYANQWKELLSPEIVSLLTQIHEYKGEQRLHIEAEPDVLTQLMEIAKVQSTEASNKIEGIFTSDERLKKLVLDKTTPRTRDEQEIAGYRNVLATIHESYDYIPPRPSMILQLHRDLYKFSGMNYGGSYKSQDNIIAQEDAQGHRYARFIPVPAWEMPEAVNQLCTEYDAALSAGAADPLLLIPMFVLDFLCIHPFNDGNGRMSRLLTLLLLYRADYIVGKYISIEKLIEQTKETYYEALQRSSDGWHEGANDYKPFVRYMLGVIVAAYREFSARMQTLTTSGLSKPDRVREVIRETLGKVTKREIMEKCPDISEITIKRVLVELTASGTIIKIGSGRGTSYIYNRERE